MHIVWRELAECVPDEAWNQMCGIVGWFETGRARGDREGDLRRMCETVYHRGPDDSGTFLSENVALGMRRLSIVDIEQGRQPVSSDDRKIQLVFNGEIYNHNELRRELSRDYPFRTHSDSEVLLRAYEAWGIEALARLNGMFSIAIWDGNTDTLYLIRDRMGVKPLYYHWDGQTCTFGSELKAVLSGLEDRPDLNMSAIWDYLTFRYVPQDNCIWEKVRKLQPGHYIELSARKMTPVEKRWWDIPKSEPLQVSYAQASDAFAALLESAVDLRMMADVPVGILLSGGLDSSVVAALANRHHPNLSTYSVGFGGQADANELAYARAVAEHLGASHHELEIGQSEFCDYLPQMVFDCDEPLADLASVPLYYITKMASGSVKVLLSGEGSDEILAGYNFNNWIRGISPPNAGTGRGRSLRARVARLMGRPERIGPDMRNADHPLAMTNYMSSSEKAALMPASAGFRNSNDRIRKLYQEAGDRGALDQVLYAYCQDWLVEDLLMKADKVSMANSVEVRTPFLDYRLVEYCFSLAQSCKVGPFAGDPFSSKRILRELGEKLVPAEIVVRPKQGFPVPAYRWLGNELKDWAESILLADNARLNGIVDRTELRRIVASGMKPDAAVLDAHIIWNLLVLELWLQRWAS